MRPIHAAGIVVLAVTGCQKMDHIPSGGTNPRVSEAYRYNRVITTARGGRVEPPDGTTAAYLKVVPMGMPIAEAKRIMEREGFTCHLIPERGDKVNKTRPGTLYCQYRNDPRGLTIDIEFQEGKVTRLRVWPLARRDAAPVDRSRADLSAKIPPGTAVADARVVMEREGFSCRLLSGRVDPTDAVDSEYLDCERWENPGASFSSSATGK